jgi:hypothetical protein
MGTSPLRRGAGNEQMKTQPRSTCAFHQTANPVLLYMDQETMTHTHKSPATALYLQGIETKHCLPFIDPANDAQQTEKKNG